MRTFTSQPATFTSISSLLPGGSGTTTNVSTVRRRSTRPRDSQRSKVYRAEDDARHQGHAGKTFKTVEEMQAYIDKLRATAWYKKQYPVSVQHRLTVTDGRGSRSARYGNGRIAMPAWSRCEAILLHELAHQIITKTYYKAETRVAPHGREFVKVLLELIQHQLGKQAADAYKKAFKEHRVKYTPKREMSPERLAELQERGRRLAAARRPSE